MAGLGVVRAANPAVPIHAPQEESGIDGSSLPSAFYRKDMAPAKMQRYFDGAPLAVQAQLHAHAHLAQLDVRV